MKYTARGESQVANIARGECYIYLSQDPHQELHIWLSLFTGLEYWTGLLDWSFFQDVYMVS